MINCTISWTKLKNMLLTVYGIGVDSDDVRYDIPQAYEEDALAWAASEGNLSVVQYLLDRDRLDLDATEGIGEKHERTPLLLAAAG